MPSKRSQLIITHSVPGLTVKVSVFSLIAMDIVLRMADRTNGKYDLKDLRDGPSEKLIWIRFPNDESLETFKNLCY